MKLPASLLLLFFSFTLAAQDFYDLNTIQKIEISFAQPNWDYMMDTAAAGSEGYIYAQWVKVNGVQFDSVGVKYKGNSSYNPNNLKNPLHISLDMYYNQSYQGYTDIKLSNGFKDPTFVREVLSYSQLRNYMEAPLSNYAQVYINNQLIGLYTNSEAITKKFVNAHFYSNDGPFFKCNSPCTGAGPQAPNLVYYGNDSSVYYCRYEIKSDQGWAQLISFINTLAGNVPAIEGVLDVDRALWMLAFNNVLVNLDSYIGAPTQNYYLYQDQNGRFNSVLWDLNETYGVFVNSGTGNLNTLVSKQQMNPLLHLNDNNWPLIKQLLAVPLYKKMYIAHMRTILQENFSNTSYITAAQSLQSVIDTAVQSDPNKFFTHAQFLSNLNTTVNGMGGQIPGISELMNGRYTCLSNHIEFQNVPPLVVSVGPSVASPPLNSNVFITASVNNAGIVMLGYRYSVMQPFTRVPMYDDGLHGDGIAGDSIFGAVLAVNAPLVQYFVYSENINAGVFSPQRAEHEFYSLYAAAQELNPGEVVINELMALNNSTIPAPNGDYEDWFELYNNTSGVVSMNNLYLSDSYNNPLKWKFPDNVTIPPQSYLLIWADNDTLNANGFHTGFKLSGSGEKLILSYATGNIVDSISFGQQKADTSYARCPNGTGAFGFLAPTPGNINCGISGVPDQPSCNLALFPNPNKGIFRIVSPDEPMHRITILNTLGQCVYSAEEEGVRQLQIDLTSYPSGLYILRIDALKMLKLVKE